METEIDAPELWEHQNEAVDSARQWLSAGYGGGLLDMDMGTGKTRVALEIARLWATKQASRADGGHVVNVLVVGGKSLLPVWSSESEAHLGKQAAVWSALTEREGTWSDTATLLERWLRQPTEHGQNIRLVAINYQAALNDALLSAVCGGGWHMLVFDEVHKLKNLSSKSYRAWQQVPAQFRLGLSGTPAPNSDMDYVAVSKLVSPDLFDVDVNELVRRLKGKKDPKKPRIYPAAPKRLKDRFTGEELGWGVQILGDFGLRRGDVVMCEVTTRAGKSWIQKVDILAVKPDSYSGAGDWAMGERADDGTELREPVGAGELAEKERRWFMGELRKATHIVRREDVMTLPRCTTSNMYYLLSEECEQMYHDISEELYTRAPDGSIVEAKNYLSAVSRLERVLCGLAPNTDQQLISTDTENNRTELVADWIGSIDAAEPLVVFCRFRSCLDQIHAVAESLGFSSCEMSGRRNELADWQDGRAKILVAQVATASEGISLTRACYALLYSSNWSASDDAQAVRRLDRPGQTRPVSVVRAVASLRAEKSSMDAIRYMRVGAKQARLAGSRAIMSGDEVEEDDE